MLVVLSMTMATQYASTKVGFSYAIVHPSNADIRFIASDNSSDGYKVLRTDDLTNATYSIKLVFGNWSENTNKTYTAAFGIVNEERFKVNITHINVTTSTGTDNMQIWVHGDRDALAENDATKVWVWNKNTRGFTVSSCVWQLGAGNGNPYDMCADGSTQVNTPWDPESTHTHVRYSISNINAVNGTSDFVWIQISLDIHDGVAPASVTGSIWVHFKATTGSY